MIRLLWKIRREARASNQRVGQVIWNAINSHSAGDVFYTSDEDLSFFLDQMRRRRTGSERPR